MNNKSISFIQQFKKGDQKAFDSLVLLHKDWVIGMICNMVHNKQDAEDISQDVFVSVYFANNPRDLIRGRLPRYLTQKFSKMYLHKPTLSLKISCPQV